MLVLRFVFLTLCEKHFINCFSILTLQKLAEDKFLNLSAVTLIVALDADINNIKPSAPLIGNGSNLLCEILSQSVCTVKKVT